MQNFLADVERARALTVAIFREASDMEMSVGAACAAAREYLQLRGYPAPDDPLAFATAGRVTMRDGDLKDQLVVRSNGEVI